MALTKEQEEAVLGTIMREEFPTARYEVTNDREVVVHFPDGSSETYDTIQFMLDEMSRENPALKRRIDELREEAEGSEEFEGFPSEKAAQAYIDSHPEHAGREPEYNKRLNRYFLGDPPLNWEPRTWQDKRSGEWWIETSPDNFSPMDPNVTEDQGIKNALAAGRLDLEKKKQTSEAAEWQAEQLASASQFAQEEARLGGQFDRDLAEKARAANLEELITDALASGQWAKAYAISDFSKRPSDTERLELALRLASSPADFAVLGALMRGDAPIQQPSGGRVAPLAPFLREAGMSVFGGGIRGGRPQPFGAEGGFQTVGGQAPGAEGGFQTVGGQPAQDTSRQGRYQTRLENRELGNIFYEGGGQARSYGGPRKGELIPTPISEAIEEAIALRDQSERTIQSLQSQLDAYISFLEEGDVRGGPGHNVTAEEEAQMIEIQSRISEEQGNLDILNKRVETNEQGLAGGAVSLSRATQEAWKKVRDAEARAKPLDESLTLPEGGFSGLTPEESTALYAAQDAQFAKWREAMDIVEEARANWRAAKEEEERGTAPRRAVGSQTWSNAYAEPQAKATAAGRVTTPVSLTQYADPRLAGVTSETANAFQGVAAQASRQAAGAQYFPGGFSSLGGYSPAVRDAIGGKRVGPITVSPQALGAPSFRGSQSQQNMLPFEREQFGAAVRMSGFPLPDFLEMERSLRAKPVRSAGFKSVASR